MMHKLKKIVVAMSLLAPVSAYSLGVGELKLHSALNESLNAEIALVLSANEDIDSVDISVASPEKFDEAGIAWNRFLSNIRFKKVSKGKNRYSIELTSNNIVQEPFLDFLLEVKWPNGNVFKSFTVLVDPAIETQRSYIEPVRSAEVTQKVITKPVKKAVVSEQNDFSSLAVAGEYGPTQRNDSIWKIAERINKNPGTSVEQVMMALYKANPKAFYKKNVNALMVGKTLKIPSNAEVNQLSKDAAKTEFYLQHDIWTGKKVARPESEVVTEDKVKQLILVSPDKEEVKDSEVLVADSEKQQKLVNKNEALQERLAILEKKFSVMQEMLAIKDKELAALQDARFSEELDAIENKEQKAAKALKEQEALEAKKALQADEANKLSKLETNKPVEVVAQKQVAVEKTAVVKASESKSTQVNSTSSSSFIETGFEYLNIWLGLLAILLLAIGAFFWRKRKDEPEEDDNIFKSTDHAMFADSQVAGNEASEELDIQADSISKVKAAERPKEVAMDDVLLDADTYLAYGKYQEAENALRKEIKAFPNKDSYKLKLLEVFYSSENEEGFNSYAQELVAEGKRSDTTFWADVSAMGIDFSSNAALFSSDVIEDEIPDFDVNLDEEPEPELDVNLDLDQELAAFVPEAEEPKEVEMTEFSFDSDELEEENITVEDESKALNIESFEFKPVADKLDEIEPEVKKEDLSDSLEMIDFAMDKSEENESELSTEMSLDEIEPEVKKEDLSDSLEMIDFAMDKSEENDSELSAEVSLDEPEELETFDMELSVADSDDSDESTAETNEYEEILSLHSEADIDLSEFDLADDLDSGDLADELQIVEDSDAKDEQNVTLEDGSDSQLDDFDFDFSVEGDESYTSPEISDDDASYELTLGDDEQKLTLDPAAISEINNAGDYETNLDLAKMYVAMGETDAAKELADDVLANGSDAQKKEAQEVLDHIASA